MKSSVCPEILVTGATSGIGLAVTRLLAGKGYLIYGVSRKGTCPEYSHPSVTFLPMDVTETESIENSLTEISALREADTPFHAVIHCAGYGIAGSALDTPIAAVRSQFETNYFGLLRLNELLMRRNLLEGSRIIILGSVAGRISIPFQSHYSGTKFALEAYTEALRIEGKPLGISAVIIEAGDTKTSFTSSRTHHTPEDSPFRENGRRAVEQMEKDEQNGHHPDFAASYVLKALKRKNPPVRMTVGLSYSTLMFLKRILPDRLAEFIVTKLYIS